MATRTTGDARTGNTNSTPEAIGCAVRNPVVKTGINSHSQKAWLMHESVKNSNQRSSAPRTLRGTSIDITEDQTNPGTMNVMA